MSWLKNMIKSIFNMDTVQNFGEHTNNSIEVKPVVEAPITKKVKSLQSMNKNQLEEHGRSLGLELDRRKSKAKLIVQIEAAQ